MALHDIQHAAWFSHWLVVMQEGWLVTQGAPAQEANVLRLLTWRRGQLGVQMQPAGEVLEEVSRCGAGKIIIVNPRLRALVVS